MFLVNKWFQQHFHQSSLRHSVWNCNQQSPKTAVILQWVICNWTGIIHKPVNPACTPAAHRQTCRNLLHESDRHSCRMTSCTHTSSRLLTWRGTHPRLEVHGCPPVEQQRGYVDVAVVGGDMERSEAALEETDGKEKGEMMLKRSKTSLLLEPRAKHDGTAGAKRAFNDSTK